MAENLANSVTSNSLTRKWILTLLFVTGLIASFGMTHLRSELRLYDLKDPAFPATLDLHEMREKFGDGHAILVLFHIPGRKFKSAEIEVLREWTRQESNRNPEISELLSPLELRMPELLPQRRLIYSKIFKPEISSPKDFTFEALKGSPWQNVLTDRTFSDFAIEVVFRDSIEKTRFGSFDPEPIGDFLKRAETELIPQIKDLKIEMTGNSSFHWYFKQMMKRDAWLNPALILVLCLFFRLFFGTWKAGALLVLSLLITTFLTYGLMGIVGHPVDLLSNNLFLMITIATVEDFLFLCSSQSGGNLSPLEALQIFRKPSFFTSLTTLIGFAALGISDLGIIKRFGLWAGVSIILEWAVIFYLFEWAVLKFKFFSKPWTDGSRAYLPLLRLFSRFKPSTMIPNRVVIWIFLGIGLVSVLSYSSLTFNDTPSSNFGVNHPLTRANQYLLNTRGWQGASYIVFEPKTAAQPELVTSIMTEISKIPGVAAIDDPNAFVTYFQRGFDSRIQSAIFMDLIQTKPYQRYFSDDGSARGVMYFESTDLAKSKPVLQKVMAICGTRCNLVGEARVFLEYSEKIMETLVGGFGLSLVLVGAVLLFLARHLSLRNQIAILISSFWGPTVMLGVAAWLKINVNLVTSMFASVMVGLAGDNTIQFLFATQENKLVEGIKKRGDSSIQLSLLLSLTSVLFLFLSLKPLKTLGGLFIAGFLVTLIGDLWLLQGLINKPSPSK